MSTDNWYTLGFVLFLAVPIIPIFFSPTLVAIRRRRKIGLVLFCNVFLGWTVLGWGLAMAIAIASDPEPEGRGFFHGQPGADGR